MPNYTKNSQLPFMLILLIATLVYGCSDQHHKLMGKYKAVNMASSDSVEATLELLAEGKGFWSIEADNTPFRWDLYQNKIRIHTNSGGVIEGTLGHNIIELTLPGMGMIRFQLKK